VAPRVYGSDPVTQVFALTFKETPSIHSNRYVKHQILTLSAAVI